MFKRKNKLSLASSIKQDHIRKIMRKCKREVILNTAAYFWLSCLKVDRALIGLKKCRYVFTTAIESLEKDFFFHPAYKIILSLPFINYW